MSNLVMMYWSCPYCNSKNIEGSKRECPHCGRPRGDGTRFYFKDDTRERISDEEAANVSREPDWYCSFCNSLNSAKDLTCRSCGSSKIASEMNYFEMKEKEEREAREKENEHSSIYDAGDYGYDDEDDYDKENYNYENSSDAVTRTYDDESQFYIGPKEKPPTALKVLLQNKVVLYSMIAFFIISFFVFLLTPKSQTISVTSHEWEKQISIEQLNTYEESSFNLPVGARVHDTRWEIESYVQVLDHYETKTRTVTDYVQTGSHTETDYVDLGNGYAEAVTRTVPDYEYVSRTETYEDPVYRSEPIYGTKYYYEIDRWEHSRYVNSKGGGIDDYWPEVTLTSEKEREGNHNESFTINALKKNKEKVYTSDRDIWITLEDGKTYKVKISLGKITEIVEEK